MGYLFPSALWGRSPKCERQYQDNWLNGSGGELFFYFYVNGKATREGSMGKREGLALFCHIK